MKNLPFIIAEAGVNHNGNVKTAMEMIEVAADAGADAVKFQTFQSELVVSKSAPKADYQMQTTGKTESQYEMIKKLELSVDEHRELIAHSKKCGVEFMSTPFDHPSLEMLTGAFGLKTIKIASGEITNYPFLLAAARVAKNVILSTGMSTIDEVRDAIGVLAFGFTGNFTSAPKNSDFAKAYSSGEGRAALEKRVTLLHCTTEYPAPVAEVNLKAMSAMADTFSVPVGYSDHTEGIHVSLAAVARGATVIEKHFTMDKDLPGPDHSASLEPNELRALVSGARDIVLALGDGIKQPTATEKRNLNIVRRSIIATRSIRKGEKFSPDNISCKRPGDGVSANHWYEVLGASSPKDFEADQLIDLD